MPLTDEEREEMKESRAARLRELEELAENLRLELVARLGEEATVVAFSVRGDWGRGFRVEGSPRHCVINSSRLSSQWSYVVQLFKNEDCLVQGKIDVAEVQETVNAVEQWLQGVDREAFCERFTFLKPTYAEETREALHELQAEVAALLPDLLPGSTLELKRFGMTFRIACVRFQNEKRAGLLSAGTEHGYQAKFKWKNAQLCSGVAPTLDEAARALQCWVLKTGTSAQLKTEFPWVEIEKPELTAFCERGEGWADICLDRWDFIAKLIAELMPSFHEMHEFMAALRGSGCDKRFRAGMSYSSLIISRSLEDGLRMGQPFIQFWLLEEGMRVILSFEERHEVVMPTRELTPEIESWLKRLEACEID